jgi:23S rRNA (guanosine2251-2'-O)-methyltransferase
MIKKNPKQRRRNLYVIAHDIRSTHNVGSLFRTADGAGVTNVFLTGYTPTPVDEYGKERGDIAKVALGAEKTISWEHKKSPGSIIKRLKTEGIYIVGLEQSEHSFPLHWFAKKKLPKEYAGVALIVGNEVQGVSKSLLKLCDILLEIPMHGEKESLNVSVAFGIAIYALAEAV